MPRNPTRQTARRSLASLLLATLVLAGCTATNMAVQETRADGTVREYTASSNPLLAWRLKVVDLKSSHKGNLLQATAELKNRWFWQARFKYQFKWFDKDGVEIAIDQRPWTPITLQGRETRSIQATAPVPSATQFKIYLQD